MLIYICLLIFLVENYGYDNNEENGGYDNNNDENDAVLVSNLPFLFIVVFQISSIKTDYKN